MLSAIQFASAADLNTIELEAKISLGDVHGRIDHLAIDLKRQRLYVAELGNDSVGVVDLKERKTLRTLTGLKEPQGIGYVPSTDTLYVANAGDGSVRLFRGENLMPFGQIALGADADNIRVDDAAHRVFVGYGDGAIAVIDTQSQRKIADIPLGAHPESFQLDRSSPHIFVNVPDAREIATVDRMTDKRVTRWPTENFSGNFPLALDEPHQRIISVFRHPAKVAAFRMQDGGLLTAVDTCGDSDDVFVDEKRKRIYVSCGEGSIDVLANQGESYISVGRIPTASGARTSLFIPGIDRLALAVRATGATPAAIWIFRPVSP
ncbi:MAG TPA: YncE family protein [Steroidobacteraceae bacterium]|nr:YncE family protein [Steroidobacteraceae bacterium]